MQDMKLKLGFMDFPKCEMVIQLVLDDIWLYDFQ